MAKPDSTIDNLEKKRKRLIFRSWHRGTKEMDLIMGRFADAHIADFSENELDQYDALLEENDPDLYNWITGQTVAPANIASDVFEKLRAHTLVKTA